MTSAVDVTVPASDEKVDKAAMRANFQTLSDEITALQARISVAGQTAFNDRPSRREVESMVAAAEQRDP